jgi:NAD(P)-dependent dehydrogenase (short-subunit alcohol dehydrogenase family)
MVLQDKTVLVIGRGSGIARGIADAVRADGANVIVAGRRPEGLAEAYGPEVRVEFVDLTDDASIDDLAKRVGRVDHVVSTASARARGAISDLDRDAVRRSFDTKVIGPLMLARAFQHQINEGGSLLIFSGVAAFKIEPATLAVAITNGAADTLTRSLAVALAPIRVNAISPGVIDTGAWDALGEARKAELFAETAARNPARSIGRAEDVAAAALLALTNPFMTGATLHVDGGERLT